jgi:hypothetical protein
MGRRNTQLRPTFIENKSKKRWLGLDQAGTLPWLGLATSAKHIDSSGEACVDQLIRWCCIDRLSWHRFRGTSARA